MTTKILLDTDIDILGDIDDACCLAYLLAQPACELVGITTVTYDTVKRAAVASALCQAAGKRIPILPGVSTPLLVDLPRVEMRDTSRDEAAVLQHWEHETTFPRGQAVEFMRWTIRDNPGQIVLLAIGPLTNVALLFAVDPEIPGLLKGLVIMAGRFAPRAGDSGAAHHPEWNVRWDPHAAAIVYRAPVAIHSSAGLDVTEQVTIDAADFERRFQPALSHPLADFARAWFAQRPLITFHDPLAAATLFDDGICRFERGAVTVDLAEGPTQGTTHWTPGSDNLPHEVALEVDPHRFFDHYFSAFGGGQ